MKRARILVVDDDRALADTLAEGLVDRGYAASALASSKEAAALLEREPFDALVTDLRMPQVDGHGLLGLSLAFDPLRPVIVMTAYGAIDSAVDAIRRGAYHYLTKPFKVDELALFLEKALAERAMRHELHALRRAIERA